MDLSQITKGFQALTPDGRLMFLARFIRLFSYGALSVVLVIYLTGIGLSESQTGTLLSLTLLGDTIISLYLTTRADRIGRRKMLFVGTVLMTGAGAAFASTGRSRWASWERVINLSGFSPIPAGLRSKKARRLAACPSTRPRSVSPAFT